MTEWKQRLFAVLMVLMAATAATAPIAVAQEGSEQAELRVEQPRHVSDGVKDVTANGTRVFIASGEYLEIDPQNFNSSDVTDFSVQEDEAVLSYDKQDREYVLNTQGNNGTFHLSWTVSADNATTTYTAQIRVNQAKYTHVPSDQYTKLRDDAKRHEGLIDSIKSSGDPDTPVEQKVEFGNNVRNFAANPFSALKGQYMALQILRFTTPAGWLDLTIILAVVWGLTRGLYSTIGRFRKQLGKEEQVSRREDEQYRHMVKQLLAGKQISDVDNIDDHQAAVLEDRLGTNLFTALQNFWSTWGADSLKRMFAAAMGSVGYSVQYREGPDGPTHVTIVDPDDSKTAADGGIPDGGTAATDPGVAETDPATVSSLSAAPDAVLDALTWDQIDTRVFDKNPDISAVDHLMVANRDGKSDLISDMNISIPEDFQSRGEFMEAVGRFLQAVQETDFTDAENRPREERAPLNHVMAFTTVLEQEYDLPMDLWWRATVWNAEGLSRDDEAESVLADITDAGAVGDGLETANGAGSGPVGGD